MDDETYKRTLEAAKAEMTQLLHDRDEINWRIAKLAPVVEYLSALCNEMAPPPDLSVSTYIRELGLTDAIRFVLKNSGTGLSPTEVRDRLREAGFDLNRYENELPPIHNTLQRLKASGEVEERINAAAGTKTYRWISGLKRALLELEPTPDRLGEPPTREEVLGHKVKDGKIILKDMDELAKKFQKKQ